MDTFIVKSVSVVSWLNMEPLGLAVNYNNTIVNSTATYSFNSIGYQLIGKATSICSVNGAWTGTVPSCQCELRLWMMTILKLIISVISCGVPDLPLVNSSGLIAIYIDLDLW